MSDQTQAGGDHANQQPPTTPPDGGRPPAGDGGQPNNAATNTQGAQQAATQAQPAQQAPAENQSQAQPFKSFASQEELDQFMQERVSRAERSGLNKEAKKLGFKSWAHLRAMIAAANEDEDGEEGDGDDNAQQGGRDDGEQSGAEQQEQQPDEAARLRLALQVGAKKNLPATLIPRLQGNTAEEMEADADALLGLLQRPPGPGIPPAPNSDGQPVTFTQEQLRDPAFVREHAAEIRRAAAEGRIVRS